MAVGFAGITFNVETPDGFLPFPVPSQGIADRYTATIAIASLSDLGDLIDLRSDISEYPALGFANAGIINTEGGGGLGELIIPVADGEATYQAVLIGIEAQSLMGHDGYYRASATWAVL